MCKTTESPHNECARPAHSMLPGRAAPTRPSCRIAARNVAILAGVVTLVPALSGGQTLVAGIRSVWAVSDGDRIAHDDLNSHYRQSNSVWDGHIVKLVAARNEMSNLLIP